MQGTQNRENSVQERVIVHILNYFDNQPEVLPAEATSQNSEKNHRVTKSVPGLVLTMNNATMEGWLGLSSSTSSCTKCRAVYKIFDLVGHFVLASQGLLGHCTFV